MHRIDELERQNKLDCWAILYLSLTEGLSKEFGRQGEDAIRESVRRFGNVTGSTIQNLILKDNIILDMETVISYIKDNLMDPRFKEEVSQINEEVYISDVYSCPLEHFWSLYSDNGLGKLFCEEFYHKFYESIFFGKSQTNLSKILTNKCDNQCQFAVYFRRSNLSKDQTDYIKTKNEENSELVYDLSEKTYLDLYFYFLETSVEYFGEGGLRTIACSLRKTAQWTINYIRERAKMTNENYDEEYFWKNHPLNIVIESSNNNLDTNKYNSRNLLETNFIELVKDSFAEN